MPQIDQLLAVYQSQWFWLALVLAVIYFGVGKAMLPKIEATVDQRDAKIAGDLAAAKQASEAAEAVERSVADANAAARNDAIAVIGQAKAKATKDAEARVAKADVGIAAKLAEAEAAVAKARAAAMKNIEAVAAEAALDIVAKVSGAKASAADAAKAVKAVLAHG
jgi:F-type H+-transporting ATPase subunit b